MFKLIKKQLLARRMRQLISDAVETIYSERFDELSALIASLSGGNDGVHLVRAYISVLVAVRLTEPSSDDDIEDAIERLGAAESRVNTPDFDAILDIYKELVEFDWKWKHLRILKGKVAHKRDEDSYHGMVYSLERDRKGPLTREDRGKVEELAKEIHDLKRQIEEHELKALKDSDSEAYQRMKAELEIRALQDEVDSHEDLNLETQRTEAIGQLEQKLSGLLRQEALEPDTNEAIPE